MRAMTEYLCLLSLCFKANMSTIYLNPGGSMDLYLLIHQIQTAFSTAPSYSAQRARSSVYISLYHPRTRVFC
ncbi:hypothetical protein FOC4_g10003782 [Fusarium odoratissimum]|uniref:Secreted protein n=1 Tax=Fusarium oxysporum f. sp. cubense (strain race 4) TaxID=2502994 RepID=N1RZ89_FUSC4|nr:hypothetical protein FOC4_g10003782 [Fusarium odoratissimum]